MNSVFKDYRRVARDYNKSFREFEDHVDRNMVQSAKKQQKLQRENNQLRQKLLDKFKRLGL